jgi:hypothetical protein
VGNKNTIELNGQKYDSLTGAVISQKQQIDGFIHAAAEPAMRAVKAAKPLAEARARAKTNIHHAHRPSHATTLMRRAVKKPTASFRPVRQVRAPAGSTPARQLGGKELPNQTSLDERRLAHSHLTNQSPAIRHFRQTRDKLNAKIEALPLSLPSPSLKVTHAPSKAIVASSSAKLDKLLASGLAQSTSHELPLLTKVPKAKSRPKSRRSSRRKLKPLAAIGILVVTAIVIAGVLFYQFLPRLDLNIASTKSGVHAVLPSYKPANFGFATPVKYASGVLTISYRQKGTGHEFSITEQNSAWDSQTLLDSFVAPSDPAYKTTQKNSQTFYIYNQTNITWVTGGIWYQISGNANLTNDQLLAIATSL